MQNYIYQKKKEKKLWTCWLHNANCLHFPPFFSSPFLFPSHVSLILHFRLPWDAPSLLWSSGDGDCMEAAQGYAPKELASQNSPSFHHLRGGFFFFFFSLFIFLLSLSLYIPVCFHLNLYARVFLFTVDLIHVSAAVSSNFWRICCFLLLLSVQGYAILAAVCFFFRCHSTLRGGNSFSLVFFWWSFFRNSRLRRMDCVINLRPYSYQQQHHHSRK